MSFTFCDGSFAGSKNTDRLLNSFPSLALIYQKEIKDAYFRLSKVWHPDLHQNSEESSARFIEIGEAYEVLGDPAKRKVYDAKIGLGRPEASFSPGSGSKDFQGSTNPRAGTEADFSKINFCTQCYKRFLSEF